MSKSFGACDSMWTFSEVERICEEANRKSNSPYKPGLKANLNY